MESAARAYPEGTGVLWQLIVFYQRRADSGKGRDLSSPSDYLSPVGQYQGSSAAGC